MSLNDNLAKFDELMHGDRPAHFVMTVVRKSNVLHSISQKVLTFGNIHADNTIHIMSPIKCFCKTNSAIGKLHVGTIFSITSFLHHGLDRDLWLKNPTSLKVIKQTRANQLVKLMRQYLAQHQLKAENSKRK